MAAGFYAKTLNASCFTNVPFCDTFSSLNSYLCYGFNEEANPMGGLQSVGCPDTQYLMTNPGLPATYGITAKGYGYTPTTLITRKSSSGMDVNEGPLSTLPPEYFFDLQELNTKVGSHTLSVGNYGGVEYTRTYEGFRYANPICAIPLRKKYSQYKPYFKNFSGVNWTDWRNSDNDVGAGAEAMGYVGEDPLGNIYNDGGERSTPMMYTREVKEPFLGEKFYEDTQTNIDKSWSKNRSRFLPFCEPIKIYGSNQKHIGYTDGMAFQVFIFRATVKDRFLPLYTYIKGENPKPVYLDTHLQYFTIELWAYLSCYGINGNNIKSPRIFTQRWWTYSHREGAFYNGEQQIKPCNPYYYLQCFFPQDKYMQFNLLPNNYGLSIKNYYTPWSMARLFIGA